MSHPPLCPASPCPFPHGAVYVPSSNTRLGLGRTVTVPKGHVWLQVGAGGRPGGRGGWGGEVGEPSVLASGAAPRVPTPTPSPCAPSDLQGDNFSNSTDSRHYGPVPYALLRGRVFFKVSGGVLAAAAAAAAAMH